MICDLGNMDCGKNNYCLFDDDEDGNVNVEGEGLCVEDPKNKNCGGIDNEAQKKKCQKDKNEKLSQKKSIDAALMTIVQRGRRRKLPRRGKPRRI